MTQSRPWFSTAITLKMRWVSACSQPWAGPHCVLPVCLLADLCSSGFESLQRTQLLTAPLPKAIARVCDCRDILWADVPLLPHLLNSVGEERLNLAQQLERPQQGRFNRGSQ